MRKTILTFIYVATFAFAASAADDAVVRCSPIKQIGKVIHMVKPVYPAEAKAANVSGTVLLRVLIGKNGAVRVVSAKGPDVLAGAASNAVSQWRYQPILLNGTPVDVESEIRVDFVLPKTMQKRH